ncbi:hypothetical protein Dimus_014720 [Dionaea muscipula]
MLPGGIARPPGAVNVGRRWSAARRRRTRASLRSTKADGVMTPARLTRPMMTADRDLRSAREWSMSGIGDNGNHAGGGGGQREG